METILYFLFFALGLVMIIKGSDWFIDSAVWAAKVFHMPQIIIGATIISICTTLPETFVSASAALQGESDIALGNALGSIAVNGGFILALLILFAKPVIENPREFKVNSALLIGAILFAFICGAMFSEINRLMGVALLLFMLSYIYLNLRFAKKHIQVNGTAPPADEARSDEDFPDKSAKTIVKMVLLFIIGITLVIIGADLLVDNGAAIAEILGVPSIVIAVTLTSIGTSLPELVTTISSIRKGAANLGVGNIIGANFLNMAQVISISSIISPIPLSHDRSILLFQFPAILFIAGTGAFLFIRKPQSVPKAGGAALLIIYILYFTISVLRENTPLFGLLF